MSLAILSPGIVPTRSDAARVLRFLLEFSSASNTLELTMAWRRKVSGGVLAFVGYMLSPLSWWNDLFVNVPLALVFAWLLSLVYRPAFGASLVLGYWLTNVLGFVLMQKGGEKIFSKQDKPYSRRALLRDMGISLLYTVLIVVLVKADVLKPIENYFEGK